MFIWCGLPPSDVLIRRQFVSNRRCGDLDYDIVTYLFSHKRWILLFLCFFTAMGSLAAQDEASALFREAETRFRKGDYLFALQRYEELIRQYPVSEYVADAQFRRAVILYRTGKAEEALSLFERVEKRYASTRFRRYIPFWKGVALFTLDRFESAASALATYLASSPDQLQAEAGRYLALSYQKLGDADKAAEAAVASLGSLSSDDGAFPYTLSLALSLLLEAGKVDQALALLQPVDPARFSADWQQRLGFFKAEALYRSGEEEESIPWYVSSLDAPADTSAPAYERLYSIYRKLGMEEEQNELFDRAMIALASRPEMLNRFLLQAGIEQFHEGSRELAESNLRRVLRTSGNADRLDLASLYLARIRADQGDRDDAIRILQERERIREAWTRNSYSHWRSSSPMPSSGMLQPDGWIPFLGDIPIPFIVIRPNTSGPTVNIVWDIFPAR